MGLPSVLILIIADQMLKLCFSNNYITDVYVDAQVN